MKNCTREKRGVGVRRKVTGNCLLPTNWMAFLRCSENRAKLFPYLSNVVVKKIQDKGVVLTANENVVTNEAALELSFFGAMQYGGIWWNNLYLCKTYFNKTHSSWQRRSRNSNC